MRNMNLKSLPLNIGTASKSKFSVQKNNSIEGKNAKLYGKTKSNNFEQILCTSLYGIVNPEFQIPKYVQNPVNSNNLKNLIIGKANSGVIAKSHTKSLTSAQVSLQAQDFHSNKSNDKVKQTLKFVINGFGMSNMKIADNNLKNGNNIKQGIQVKYLNSNTKEINSSQSGEMVNKKINNTIKQVGIGKNEFNMEFIKEGNKVIGKVIVDNTEMKQLLDSNLLTLQKTLTKAGINVDKVDIVMCGEKHQKSEIRGQVSKNTTSFVMQTDSKVKTTNSQSVEIMNKKIDNTIKQVGIGKNEFNMEFIKEGNKVIGKVIVGNAEMKQLLNSNLLALQKTLTKAGIKVDKIDIVMRGEKQEAITQKLEIRDQVSKNTTSFVMQTDSKVKTTNDGKEFAKFNIEELTNKSQMSKPEELFTITQNDKKGVKIMFSKPQATAFELRDMANEIKTAKNQGNSTESHSESTTRGQDNNSRFVNSQKVISQASPGKFNSEVDAKISQDSMNKTDSKTLSNSEPKISNLNLGLNKELSVKDLGNKLKFNDSSKKIPLNNFEKLAKQLKLNFKEGRGEAKIELKPDKLGKLSIKLVIEDSKLAGKIVVDTLVTKHLLETSLSDLRSALKTAGLEVENFDVSLYEDSENQKDSHNKSSRRFPYFEKSDLKNSDWFFNRTGFSEGINYANDIDRIDYFA